jgi:hypothetical protein
MNAIQICAYSVISPQLIILLINVTLLFHDFKSLFSSAFQICASSNDYSQYSVGRIQRFFFINRNSVRLSLVFVFGLSVTFNFSNNTFNFDVPSLLFRYLSSSLCSVLISRATRHRHRRRTSGMFCWIIFNLPSL